MLNFKEHEFWESYVKNEKNYFLNWRDFINKIDLIKCIDHEMYYQSFNTVLKRWEFFQLPSEIEYKKQFDSGIFYDIRSGKYEIISYMYSNESFNKNIIVRKDPLYCTYYTQFSILPKDYVFSNHENHTLIDLQKNSQNELTDYDRSLLHDQDLEKRRNEIYQRLSSYYNCKK